MSSIAIRNALDSVLQPGDEIIVLHSKLTAFRIPKERFRWHLVRAYQALVGSGRTVAIPAFTFDFCRSGRFDARTSRPETGALATWALTFEEFRRTANPIYSFAVAGPCADQIVKCPSSTTFDKDSPFGVFDSLQTRFVMFGCDWDVCTQFHFYEEQAGVPYRHYKSFDGEHADGTSVSTRMYVRDSSINAENDFSPAVEALRGEGAIQSVRLGEGLIESVASTHLARVCRNLLSRDPYALVRDAAHVRYCVELLAGKG